VRVLPCSIIGLESVTNRIESNITTLTKNNILKFVAE